MSSQTQGEAPRLLLDEHIWTYLSKLLRAQGFDVIHVAEVDLVGSPDDKVMEYAVDKRRAVVTFNIKHFIPLAAQYYDDRKEHYGIVVSNQLSRGELQRRVGELLKSVTAEDLMNSVRYL